ncbi:MAG: ribose 5-phosphate isomerase B [Rhodospirillales bacterium]|jgi:ribose 5-phosphate isomerase B
MSSDPIETIAIACDHGGVELKLDLVNLLMGQGFKVLDLGTNGPKSVDYPEFAYALAEALKVGKASRGVLICGSGIGISIAANRLPEVRAALIHDALGARMCREHNNANVIVFGGRTIGVETARDCLNIFIKTEFEGGRHQRRVDKLFTSK